MKIRILLILSIIVFVVCQQKANCQQNINEALIFESIKLETDSIFNKLVEIRRDFHTNPELAKNEIRTQKMLKKYLLELGLEVKTDVYGYGIVGILTGEKSGKKIAWRCELDALPQEFPDNVNFKSTIKGVKHGCGHDVHMAIALGIAEILAKNKKSFHGTVYFIFQPEEETFIGAKGMIDNGLLSKINPDEIYALHITDFPVGQIVVRPNEMFAYQKGIRVELKNNFHKEALTALTTKITKALTRIKNGSKPWEIQNMVDQNIGLSNPNTIFKDYCILGGDFINYTKKDKLVLEAELYETDKDKLKDIIPTIKKVIKDQNYTKSLISVSFIKENPTIMNDPQLTNISVKILDKVYGKRFVITDYGQVPFFNDDIAYFQQKLSGVYFFLGGSNFEKGIIAMNHAPNFEVDEECIKTGVRAFSSLIFERLK